MGGCDDDVIVCFLYLQFYEFYEGFPVLFFKESPRSDEGL